VREVAVLEKRAVAFVAVVAAKGRLVVIGVLLHLKVIIPAELYNHLPLPPARPTAHTPPHLIITLRTAREDQ
jgi:hypothetical protein